MITNITKGILNYFKALGFIRKHKLHSYFCISGIISLLLGCLIFFIAYSYSDNLASFFQNLYPFENGKEIYDGTITVLIGLIIIVVGILLLKYLILIFTGPFMGPLSEKVESIVLNNPQSKESLSISKMGYEFVRGLRISVRNIVRELFFTVLILLLSFIPLLAFLTTPVIFVLQSYYVGFGNIDYYLERRANVKQSIRYIRQNKGLAIGNGIGFLVLLMIPVIGLFLAPVLGTVAGTLSAIENSKD